MRLLPKNKMILGLSKIFFVELLLTLSMLSIWFFKAITDYITREEKLDHTSVSDSWDSTARVFHYGGQISGIVVRRPSWAGTYTSPFAPFTVTFIAFTYSQTYIYRDTTNNVGYLQLAYETRRP